MTISIGQYVPTHHDDDEHARRRPTTSSTTTTTTTSVDDRLMRGLRVAVLGGGRSSEHEVSLASAASVAEGLRAAGHEVRGIEIGRDGGWRSDGQSGDAGRSGRGLDGVDVVFPVLHGPFGEDGTVQGLLECLDVPYVGAGVLAIGAVHGQGRVQGPDGACAGSRRSTTARSTRRASRPIRRGVLAELAALGLPVFVKPARLGSSVGIATRRAGRASCAAALTTAFEHDSLAIVEAAAAGLEVECSVLGNDDPIASEPGEILLAAGEAGWYDYEAKYTAGGMQLIVPARVCEPESRERVRELAVEAFRRVRLRGPRARRLLRRRRARCSSTSSTRCPASRRRACTRRCSRPAGSRTRELLDRLCAGRGALALERRHGASPERRHRSTNSLRDEDDAAMGVNMIESVAIVGAGFMGTGIAESVAVAGTAGGRPGHRRRRASTARAGADRRLAGASGKRWQARRPQALRPRAAGSS